ncbi:type I glyceraldehyde-3-phosphate dehydrogenase [Candidatus Peregrinibacteria bacterium]|nr:type I glyceraldehyde-3-phosphate dehydrogenase [Candidatus Peregrinibacteria bacterium]
MSVRIAINGYGRIGRNLHRQILETKDIEVVAINSRADALSHAHLLKHDSLYGKCNHDIKVEGSDLVIDGKKVFVYQVHDPADLDFRKYDVDVLIEATGKFTSRADVKNHLDAGVKKVIITAPCDDLGVPNIVMGVNNADFKSGEYDVVSNASCTTNCLAPVLQVLHSEYVVEMAFVTTVHAFTYTQNLLDNSNPEDFRRARATTESIIPTTTGAMKAIYRVIPSLKGKVDGMAFRVPIPTVSCIDVVAKLKKHVSAEQLNKMFKKYEASKLKGILGTCDEPLVSIDFRGDKRSAVIDTLSTKVLPGGFLQVMAWYDNEWAYVSRILDLIRWFV